MEKTKGKNGLGGPGPPSFPSDFPSDAWLSSSRGPVIIAKGIGEEIGNLGCW